MKVCTRGLPKLWVEKCVGVCYFKFTNQAKYACWFEEAEANGVCDILNRKGKRVWFVQKRRCEKK